MGDKIKVKAAKTKKMVLEIVQDAEYWRNRPLSDAKKDWEYEEDNWISGYWASRNHEHRKLIVDELKKLSFDSLLEVGCNCGPNLEVVRRNFPHAELAGVDVNERSVLEAQTWFPGVRWGYAQELNFPDKSHDVVLSDAVLMYVPPEEIGKVMDEIVRVAKKAVILIEWFDISKKGVVRNFHWCRDYSSLLEERGMKVERYKLPKELWATPNWTKNGYVFLGKFLDEN